MTTQDSPAGIFAPPGAPATGDTNEAARALDALTTQAEPSAPDESPAGASAAEPPAGGKGRKRRSSFGPRAKAKEMRAAGRALEQEVAALRARLGQDAPAEAPAPGAAPAAELGTGTPRLAGEELAAVERELAKGLAGGLVFLGKALAGARGKHWEFSTDEAAYVGEQLARPLAPLMGGNSPWANAAVALIVVIGPRILQDVQAAREAA